MTTIGYAGSRRASRAEALVVANRHEEAVEQLEGSAAETSAARLRQRLAWPGRATAGSPRPCRWLLCTPRHEVARFDTTDRAEVTFAPGCAFRKIGAEAIAAHSAARSEHARAQVPARVNAHGGVAVLPDRRDWMPPAGTPSEASIGRAPRWLAQAEHFHFACRRTPPGPLLARLLPASRHSKPSAQANTLATARALSNLGGSTAVHAKAVDPQ